MWQSMVQLEMSVPSFCGSTYWACPCAFPCIRSWTLSLSNDRRNVGEFANIASKWERERVGGDHSPFIVAFKGNQKLSLGNYFICIFYNLREFNITCKEVVFRNMLFRRWMHNGLPHVSDVFQYSDASLWKHFHTILNNVPSCSTRLVGNL